MCKIIHISIILLLISLLKLDTLAQSISSLEKSYGRNQKDLLRETQVLDSLQQLLDEKAIQITYEKNKKNPDKDRIVELMSSSITISNKYETQQKKVNQLENKLEFLGKELINRYSAIIDSLEYLKDSGEYASTIDELDAEILFYLEKKLVITPKISLLSFDPAELLKINLDKTKDTQEKVIYREYLQNAYNELNSHLSQVNEQYAEVSGIILLQNKTEKFLKETEFESGLRTRTYSSERTRTSGGSGETFTDPDFTNTEAVINERYRGYSLLLEQLNLDLSTGKKLDWKIDSMNGNAYLNLKQYKKVLEELMTKLKEYKLVLGNRLGIN